MTRFTINFFSQKNAFVLFKPTTQKNDPKNMHIYKSTTPELSKKLNSPTPANTGFSLKYREKNRANNLLEKIRKRQFKTHKV